MNKLTLLYPEFWFREIFHRFLYSGLHCCHFIQNLPWSYVALPLLYIQSHPLSKKQTYLLPFSLWLRHQPQPLLAIPWTTKHTTAPVLFQCYFLDGGVLSSSIPTAHYCTHAGLCSNLILSEKFFLNMLSKIASPISLKTLLSFSSQHLLTNLHVISLFQLMLDKLCVKLYLKVSSIKDKNLLYSLLYPHDLKEHLVQLTK